jgi:hypothetical protein
MDGGGGSPTARSCPGGVSVDAARGRLTDIQKGDASRDAERIDQGAMNDVRDEEAGQASRSKTCDESVQGSPAKLKFSDWHVAGHRIHGDQHDPGR